MTRCQVPAALIHQIQDELDKEEEEMMVFLCRDLAPDLATADLREILAALNEREKLSPLGLCELLYRVKRFDLLRRILNTEKATVEAHLTRSLRLVPDYRVLMIEINENLEKEEIGSLVFLLRDYTPRMKMAKDKSFLALVIDLEKLNLLAPNQLDLIENCFRSIHRIDLIRKIQNYKHKALMSSVHSQPVYVNAHQASLPNLNLIEPLYNLGIHNGSKEKLQNGQSPTLAEPVHMSIQESGSVAHKFPHGTDDHYRMQSQPLGICLIIDCIGNDTGTDSQSCHAWIRGTRKGLNSGICNWKAYLRFWSVLPSSSMTSGEKENQNPTKKPQKNKDTTATYRNHIVQSKAFPHFYSQKNKPNQTLNLPQEENRQCQGLKDWEWWLVGSNILLCPAACMTPDIFVSETVHGQCIYVVYTKENGTDVLEETFRGLGYDVCCHRYLNTATMKQTLLEVARLQNHRNCDSFICILVSRGDHQSIFCTDHTYSGFPLEQIKKCFVPDLCPGLLGKPKLFFIQSYIVPENEQECTSLLEVDGNDKNIITKVTIPQGADIFWSHCKVNVSALEKSSTSSSYYLRCLVELLRDPFIRKLSISDIHTELNRRVYKWNETADPCQQYSLLLQHTLTKELFLFPT